jgi:tetratricopeptide (TPR) repeat protein
MKVADLLSALSELRAGRVTVEQLIAACSAWSKDPTRPLADFLKRAPAVPLAEPASGILGFGIDRSPTTRRPVVAKGNQRGRTLMLVGAGAGILILTSLAVGLGYMGRLNSILEASNAKLTAANAELEATNTDLTKSKVDTPKSPPSSPRAAEQPRDQLDPASQFLFRMLRPPEGAKDGKALTVAQALAQAEEEVEHDRDIDPSKRVPLLNAIGHAYDGLGLSEDARRIAERSDELQHPGSAGADVQDPAEVNARAVALNRVGKTDEAIRMLETAYTGLRRAAGPADPKTMAAAMNLANMRLEAGRLIDAVKLLEEVERHKTEAKRPDAPAVALTLAHALAVVGQADRAIELCERVRDNLPDNDPLVPKARVEAALAFRAAGKWSQARSLFLEHLVYTSQKNGEQSKEAAEAKGWMAECLLNVGDADGAEPLARECVGLRTKLTGDDWSTFAAKSLHGEVLLAQKKPDQAEPLLKQGYDGLKARRGKIAWDRRSAVTDSAGRLAKLYEARGDKAKAAEWKKVEEQERGKK